MQTVTIKTRTRGVLKKLTKVCTIRARQDEVFKALTDPEMMEEWTGGHAVMNLERGGEFQLWDGSIQGINLVVSPELIVQNWKSGNWTEFSRVTFNISEKGDKTRIELVHENIPEEEFASVKSGWDEFYFSPLKELLEAGMEAEAGEEEELEPL